jgi:hypothetical protein
MPIEPVPIDAEEDSFTCYHCKDGDCDSCVGVPCQCECPARPRDHDFEEEYF